METIRFSSICRKNGLDLDDGHLAKLEEYVSLLVDWNTRINLISRNDTANIWNNHILHSLSILFFEEIPTESRLLDLGTGGGLPGIPLAIVRTDLNVTLLDSIKKKTTAVQAIVNNLSITNVKVVTGRAEEIGRRREFSKQYDLVVSRAVAPLDNLIKWSGSFVKQEGSRLIALKGGDLNDELNEARLKTKCSSISVKNLVFSGSEEMGLEEKKIVTVII